MVDLFLVYQFIRKLTKPFTEWPAYKLGIIDEKGKVLIPRKKFKTTEQKKAFTILDVMIANLKKLLEKLPGGSSQIASYAAALWLIKEWNMFQDDKPLLTEDVSDVIIEDSMENFKMFLESVEEDVTVGSGQIAGLGVGPDGEPGLTKAQQKKYKKKNQDANMISFKESLKMQIAARGNVADAIFAYAKKSGGIDKDDMMDVAIAIETGDLKKAKTLLNKMDTDPREWIQSLLKKKNFKL